jgi:hypothetical protein
MASAGRILIIPRGDWNAETEYEMLDLVNHNGKSWLAKKTCTGIEPSEANAEYWQNMFDITAERFGALSKNGGELNGDLYIKKTNNGYVMISKNHSESADYGLDIFDYDSKGNRARLSLKANDKTENAIGLSINSGPYHRLFGEHNVHLLKNSVFLTKTYSGTTDANGFLKPNDITVDTTSIVSCGISNGSGFCTAFNDTDAHWSFKFENWDRTPVANKFATVKVIYMTI